MQPPAVGAVGVRVLPGPAGPGHRRIAVNRQRATFAANTGGALLLKGQISDAIERYQEAVASDPTYVDAHQGLAVALERAGRTAEALIEKQKAAQLSLQKKSPRSF